MLVGRLHPSTSTIGRRGGTATGLLHSGPVQSALASRFHYAGQVLDALVCTSGGPERYLRRQRRRLDALMAHARHHAPIYRERFRDLPAQPRLEDLPPLRRPEILARFDECVTDPDITLDRIDRHLTQTERAGSRLLDRYYVWSTSGSSGMPLPLVHDPEAVTLYQALTLARGWLPWFNLASLPARLRSLDRVAVLTIGHPGVQSAGMAAMSRSRRPWPFNDVRVVSLADPLPDIVAQLNRLQPAEVFSYASGLHLLCEERRQGRLTISPVLLSTGGETVTSAGRAEIETTFGVPLRENYGALEFPRLSWGCRQGSLHVSADWLILEPVDEHDRPVPPGHRSATVLITNLANRVQPIIRYDLGDLVTMPAAPCPCGNPLPTVTVQGRSSQVLWLRSANGERVRLLPTPLTARVGHTPGVHRYQIVQTGPSSLTIRLEIRPGSSRQAAWQEVLTALHDHLKTHRLSNVTIGLSPELPRPDQASQKLRTVYTDLAESEPSEHP